MQPRLKSSKKWTAFPKEYTDQIQGVFRDNFAEMIGEGKILVEGRIYTAEVMLRVGYLEPGRLKQANFEVSMDYSPDDKDALARIHNCVDAAASMMLEYFDNDGEVDFPLLWKAYPFQKKTLYLQYSTENSALEAEANKLLGVDEDSILQEESEDEEDALSRAEIDEELSGGEKMATDVLGDAGEDEEDPEDKEDDGPRMFGGKKKTRLH